MTFFAPLAHGAAYLDPGSGSLLLQMLIALFLGAGFTISVYWKKIKRFFKKGADAPAETIEIPEDTHETGGENNG
ncbi:MAG TPA: hypothetical protein PLA25_06215 [Anaerolineaceae bacterium]|nr:hypothetical protein [Anaerolineaceae bacterium]HQN43708.1 hypothetical protein [Anaerolineaceae bacterium]